MALDASTTLRPSPLASTGALAPHHYQMLAEASGIADAIIAARGYHTVTQKTALRALGFSAGQCQVPALVLPVHNVHGDLSLYQIRPDRPRWKDGRLLKYETPANAHMALDVPPMVRPLLGNPQVPLFVTEGIKKGDALASHGVCAVALLGVWNWRGSNADHGTTVLAAWESIALNDRPVYLVFDSDVMQKPPVHQALARLKAFLASRHARVQLMYLPAGPGGVKVGVDDYLVAGHSVDELYALATPTLRGLPPEEPLPLPYRATPQGLVWLKPTSQGALATPLTNFTATIVADIVEDDGADVRRLFELEARRNGHTTRFTVPAGQFASLGWVPDQLGAEAVVLPGVTRKDHARAAMRVAGKLM